MPARGAAIHDQGTLTIAGRYRVIGELGRGGMGAVYRAVDEGTGAMVALKLLSATGERARQLFRREFETLAKLAHPRVIRVFEYGTTETGSAYYTMELLRGRDLAELAPLPWRHVCELMRDVCTSLALLHAQRLVHRDVNPRNVRVDDDNRAKLLDFGALSDFGRAREVVGAPSCVAPESLRGEPLDGRADLFALGVVAYWALTQRLPYPVSDLASAERAWCQAPAAPSTWIADIPASLDELVLSLLAVDPLARPSSAADVLDRVSAIATLDDELLSSIAESHIKSASLVGRARELAELREILGLVWERSKGTTLTIESESGGGKSRFLQQLVVDAQLHGWITVELSARTCTDAEQVLTELVRALESRLPVAFRSSDALRAQARRSLDHDTSEGRPTASDRVFGHERVLRMQLAATQLVVQVAEQVPLMLCIDDADALTERAASLLPLLAHAALERRLLLVTTRDRTPAPPAVEQLRWLGSTIALGPLDQSSIERLMTATFGEAPHVTRLARWLTLASRGNPARLSASLLHLVHRRVIRYGGGAWILPADVSVLELREEHTGLTDKELAELSAAARALLGYLCAHNDRLTDSACAALVDDPADASAMLEQRQLILRVQDGIQLTRESIATTVLARMSQRERRARHEDLARVLAAECPLQLKAMRQAHTSALADAELLRGLAVGRHLLLADREDLATPLLRNGAIELTIRGENLDAAIPLLSEAVETYRARGRAPHIYGGMMTVLALGGLYTDWRLSLRYGEEMIDELCNASGITVARRLSRYLMARLALYLGLAVGFLLWLCLPIRRRLPKFAQLFLGLIGLGSGVLAVCTLLNERARAGRVLAALAPLGFFPRSHAVRQIYEFQLALNDQLHGRYDEALRKSEIALAYVRSPRARRALPERGRIQLEGGILTLLGLLEGYRNDEAGVVTTMEDIERVVTSTSRQTHASVRAIYHAQRGERESYLLWRGHTDRLAAEHGSTWRHDVQMPRVLWSTHTLCGDVLTLKRDVEHLRELAAEVAPLSTMRDVVEACYMSERGMPAEALALHQEAFLGALDEPGPRSLQYLGMYVRILRKAGRSAEALALCERRQSTVSEADERWTMLAFPFQLEFVLAAVAVGDTRRARELLDRLHAAQQRNDNPMLHGLCHAASAELALAQRDWPSFDEQLAAMRRWLSETRHPSLVAQCQRLAERARTARAEPRWADGGGDSANERALAQADEPDFDTEIA